MPRDKIRNFQLTKTLLNNYMNAAMINADELIEEANVLNDCGHTARAYFLAVAAIEEIGKAMLAFDGQERNIKNPEVSHRLKLAFEDHHKKISAAFIPWLKASKNKRETIQTATSLATDLSIGREPSMYTEINPNGPNVQSPKDVVSANASSNCIRLAKDTLACSNDHIKNNAPSKPTQSQDSLFCMKSERLEKLLESVDFWEYFISKRTIGEEDLANVVTEYTTNYLSKNATYRGSSDERATSERLAGRD